MSDMSKCDGRLLYFCFNDTATTEIYTYLHTLSLHDALPISASRPSPEIASETSRSGAGSDRAPRSGHRSEEHTSELQSLMRISYAVFCLKKKNYRHYISIYTITYQHYNITIHIRKPLTHKAKTYRLTTHAPQHHQTYT